MAHDSHQHDLYGHHHHGVSHAHVPPHDAGKAFMIGTILNLIFVGVELVAGVTLDSVALIADAGHNASDVLGLLLAWGAQRLSLLKPRGRFTYGFGSASILAALLNAGLLLVAAGAIAMEAIGRFGQPHTPEGIWIMAVAGVGVVINLGTAFAMARQAGDDLNVRGAYLHMMADALVSFAVIIAGALMMATGVAWIDPVAGLIVAAMIVWGSWGLMRESVESALNAAPRHVDLAAVEAHLLALEGVSALHDLHVWPLSTRDTALSAHLVMPNGHPGDAWMDATCLGLEQTFGVSHATIQIELGDMHHAHESCTMHGHQHAGKE